MKSFMIVYFDLGIGGVQKKIINIVNHLAESQNYKDLPIYLLLETNKKFNLVDLISNHNVRIIYKKYRRVPLWLFILFNLFLYNPSTVLTFLPILSVYTLMVKHFFLFWRKMRIVVSEDIITTHSYKRGDFPSIFLERISKYFPQADSVIAPSPHVKQDLIDHFDIPENLVSIIPNWCKVSLLSNQKKETDLVYIGRLDPEKNLMTLLSIALRLKEKTPNIKLWIIGEGKEGKKIASYIKNSHLDRNIKLLGPRKDIDLLLSKAKIAVITSTSEGMPLFILEAMGYGLPVVAMECPGVNDLVLNNKTGFLCSSRDEFAGCVLKLLKDNHLRNNIGWRARKRAEKRYSGKNLDLLIDQLFDDQ